MAIKEVILKMYKINFTKTNKEAWTPKRAHNTDSGYDIAAIETPSLERDDDGYIKYLSYNSGIAVSPPENIYFLLYPRSSIRKYNILLCNSVGVIDTSYRGDIIACFSPTIRTKDIEDLVIYKKGDRIAQLIPQIRLDIDFLEFTSLQSTDRDCKGFGSSGQ